MIFFPSLQLLIHTCTPPAHQPRCFKQVIKSPSTVILLFRHSVVSQLIYCSSFWVCSLGYVRFFFFTINPLVNESFRCLAVFDLSKQFYFSIWFCFSDNWRRETFLLSWIIKIKSHSVSLRFICVWNVF